MHYDDMNMAQLMEEFENLSKKLNKLEKDISRSYNDMGKTKEKYQELYYYIHDREIGVNTGPMTKFKSKW